MERFTLSEIQAKAIVDMRLRRLQGLEREKIDEEYKELSTLIQYLRDVFGKRTDGDGYHQNGTERN
jgi:DNA gyrase subunit A